MFFSCKREIIRDCTNTDLGKKITIIDWGNKKIFASNIRLFCYDSLFKNRLDTILIDYIKLYNDKESTTYGQLELSFKESLFSKKNYQLIISDSLKYNISDIKIYTETVMAGMIKKNFCLVDSLKINDVFIQSLDNVSISFSRNLK
jgi:hypothetical protein